MHIGNSVLFAFLQIWHCFYLLVVWISCLILCLETVHRFRVKPFIRHITSRCQQSLDNPHGTKMALKLANAYCLDAIEPILYTGLACTILFTIELVCGLIVCPSKKLFFKNFLNIVAFITTITMWCCFIFDLRKELLFSSDLAHLYGALKCVSILRILLFFRLTRLFNSLKVLLQALKSSAWELLLLLICVILSAMMFGAIMYNLEFSFETSFENMFISMWWAVITITTVGYGDIIPNTVMGKVVGAGCSVAGLMLLTLPVAIVVSNFADYHKRSNDRQRHLNAKNGLTQKTPPRNSIGSVERIKF